MTSSKTPPSGLADQNVDRLLRRSLDPPRIDGGARRRILLALQERGQERLADEPEAAPEIAAVLPFERQPSAAATVVETAEKTSTRAAEPPHPTTSSRRVAFLALAAAVIALIAYVFYSAPEPREATAPSTLTAPDQQTETQAPPEETPEPVAEPEPVRLVNDDVAPRVHTLRDGSTVTLRQGVALTEVRPRHLRVDRGDLLLDVVKDQTPFTVESPHGTTTVLGTRFFLASETDATRVAVLRGSVSLSNDQGDVTLRAGEQATLSPDSPPTREPAPRTSHLTSWARDAQRAAPDAVGRPARKGALIARLPQWSDDEWPLPMRALKVDAHVEGDVARVTLDQTFFNHTQMTLEGVYSLTLPPDAAISRMAMYVAGRRMEAGIVERQRARKIYEDIVMRRRDPALLEWMEGNRFQIRIFPLFARQEKRLFVSYTQTLERLYNTRRLHVPMPEVDGDVRLVEMSVRVVGGAGQEILSSTHEIEVDADGDDALVRFTARDDALERDLILTLVDPEGAPRQRVARFDDKDARYLQARIQPELPGSESAFSARRWVLLNDVSASRSPLEEKAQRFILEQLIDAIDEDDLVAIVDFDATPRDVLTWTRAGALTSERLASLRGASVGVGNTNLSAAFDHAIALLGSAPDDGVERAPHILLLSDGVDTHIASLDRDALAARVAARATVVTVGLGATIDATTLRILAARSGGFFTTFNPGEDLAWRALDLVAALNTPRLLDVEVELQGADGLALQGAVRVSRRVLAAGEQLSVITRLEKDEAPRSLVVRGLLGDQLWERRYDLTVTDEVQAAYLPRLWARAEVGALIEEGAEVHQERITELGMTHWLMTPFTSLLVLEDEKMYAKYKVTRGSAKGWARYDSPEQIEVIQNTVDRALLNEPDTLIVRWPLPLLSLGSHMNYLGVEGLAGETFSNQNAQFWTVVGGQGVGAGGGGTGGGMLKNDLGRFAVDRVSAASGPRPDQWKAPGYFFSDADILLPSGAAGALSNSKWNDQTLMPFGQRLSGKSGSQRSASRGPVLSTGLRARSFDSKGRGLQHGWMMNQHYLLPPQRYHYPNDPSFGDLTLFIPGLYSSAHDLQRDQLLARGVAHSGSISDDARRVIEAARAQLAEKHFVDAEGARLTIGAEGTFRVEQRHGPLNETIEYDGQYLRHVYPEMGLFTTRTIDVTSPALLVHVLPFLLAHPEHLARFYDVTLEDANTLRLRVPGTNEDTVITLDAARRVVSIRRLDDEGAEQGAVHIEHRPDGSVAVREGDEEITIWRAANEGASAPTRTDLVEVEMPLRTESYWQARIDAETVGSPEWRRLLAQQLVAFAASSQNHRLFSVIEALSAQGPLRRGERVLGSAATLSISSSKDLNVLIKGADEDLREYLRAAWRQHHTRRDNAFSLSKAPAETGLIGMLRAHQRFLETTHGRQRRFAMMKRRHEAFREEFDFAPLLYVQIYQLINHHGYSSRDGVVALLEPFMARDDYIGEVVRYEVARLHYQSGDPATALKLFNAAFDVQLADGQIPRLTHDHYYSLTSSPQGVVEWSLFWARWKRFAATAGDARHHAALMMALQITGRWQEIDAILTSLPPVVEIDTETFSIITQTLLQGGRFDLAKRLLDARLNAPEPPPPALLLSAAQLAEAQGQTDEAANFYEAYLDQQRDLGLALGDFRWLHQRLIELHSRKALAGEKVSRAKVLRWAASWRAEDPDNAQIDLLTAQLLFSLGEDEASWRHLSSIIERHPMQGDALASVARVLEEQGNAENAGALWARAAEVEPTNPTWPLSQAQNLISRGEHTRAAPILEGIVEGEWHERFNSQRYHAKRLLTDIESR